jgi:hypothetical protein
MRSSCRCCPRISTSTRARECIADLLLIAKVRRDENRIGVIANRVKRNTMIYQSLMRFLETLRIPVIATLRDSQNYVRAAEQGVGSARDEAEAGGSGSRGLGAAARVAARPRRALAQRCRFFGRQRTSIGDVHLTTESHRLARCTAATRVLTVTSSLPSCPGPCRPSSCSCASCRGCW